MINRRGFLQCLAPLAVLPVVGPSMLLSERPTFLGWTGALSHGDDEWGWFYYKDMGLMEWKRIWVSRRSVITDFPNLNPHYTYHDGIHYNGYLINTEGV